MLLNIVLVYSYKFDVNVRHYFYDYNENYNVKALINRSIFLSKQQCKDISRNSTVKF